LKYESFGGFPDIILSIGDTPGCSVAQVFPGIDEIRPGNFVFYDLMQYKLGVCSLKEIAIALACPVIRKVPKGKKLLIYGGAVHLSKESLLMDNKNIYGLAVKLNVNGWSTDLSDSYVVSVSQEHGIISASDILYEDFGIGDIIAVLPIHSCLTANAMGKYVTLDNKTVDHMKTTALLK